MLKKTGEVLIGILLVVTAVAILSGCITGFWPAEQLSGTAQRFIEPSKDADTFPITTLGNIKDKKQKLEVIKATADIVTKEIYDKAKASQDVYNLMTPIAAAMLSFYLTSLYKNRTMYSETEVTEIKNGKA